MSIRRGKWIISLVLVVVVIITGNLHVFADSGDIYVSLGADLTASEKTDVLELLGLTDDDLDAAQVNEITNAQEKETLGAYLPASVIGSRALSSVKVEKQGSGHGITVTTKNISYCTEGMYQNALITAGVEDAEVTVAGPYSISGTAGLVGAMQSYQEMTGKNLSEESQDAAVNEIVTTGELAASLGGAENAENIMAMVKQKVISGDLTSEEDILQAVDDVAGELGITLNDDEKQMILQLMKKIGSLDIDVDALKQQASGIYDRLADIGVDMSSFDKQTFIDTISSFFSGIINYLKNLFN